jgi:aryl-alcohol dehydrogenase-like predicted oxidoreductase
VGRDRRGRVDQDDPRCRRARINLIDTAPAYGFGHSEEIVGATTALWGARHPGQLQPIDEVFGWSLDAVARTEIDRILRESIADPVGPAFMAPPPRRETAVLEAAQ